MEKRSCKLCVKSFANGRALGGHMRSHGVNFSVPAKTEHNHGGDEVEAASHSYSSSPEEEEAEIEERELLGYGLRENPKKSVKLVDPEFNFAVDTGSVVLQDRESETETSKNNAIRRRSKRIRKSEINPSAAVNHQCHRQKLKEPEMKKQKPGQPDQTNSVEPEPVSSISDATTEEDVAYCLMMLSRDKWMTEKVNYKYPEEDDEEEDEAEEEEEEEDDDDEELEEEEEEQRNEIDEIAKYKKTQKAARGKYKCETCFKVFRSYQALGGHRASHKKNRASAAAAIASVSSTHHEIEARNEEKIHECPVCFRVFSSGQALGGHKRSHVLGSAATNVTSTGNHVNTTTNHRAPPSRFAETLIDLNLPAPIDDDEFSQFELSAVSDAEFVKSIKH